jgi:threonine synthase
MHGFETTRAMRLTNAQQEGAAGLLTSARADGAEMAGAMRWAAHAADELIDPHTACALHAARAIRDFGPAVPIVTLATAHPAKFRDPVERATGRRPTLPTRVGDLFGREERMTELPGNYAAVADWIAARAVPRG